MLRCSTGFTLVELIAVMVILGIIGMLAAPRLFDRQSFDARGFFDQTKAAIRYAQKTAIAHRRPVFVNVTVNSICLTYVADANCTNVNSNDIVLSPASGQRFFAAAPSGINFVGANVFSFSALGRPSAAVAIGVTGDGMVRNITVEGETGYVH